MIPGDVKACPSLHVTAETLAPAKVRGVAETRSALATVRREVRGESGRTRVASQAGPGWRESGRTWVASQAGPGWRVRPDPGGGSGKTGGGGAGGPGGGRPWWEGSDSQGAGQILVGDTSNLGASGHLPRPAPRPLSFSCDQSDAS